MFSDACITHHSAFEVFGYGSQVFYECFVATDKRFSDFEYDGVVYRRMERKSDIEVIHQGNIWVTSVEQTVVDSIRDFEKIAGLEEVMRCMMLLPGLNEEKVLECLARSKNGFCIRNADIFLKSWKRSFIFLPIFLKSVKSIPLMQRGI